MNRKKTFFTLMENLENYHLIKDVGMVPYFMYRVCDYESYVVSYGKEEECFNYLESNVKGLKINIRKKYTGNTILDGCFWIMKNARRINVLNLYHYKLSSFVWISIYKIFNHKGKVYLKLDVKTEDGIKMKMKKRSLKWFATKMILGKCDVISCETEYFQKYANANWPVSLKYIPNGVSEKDIDIMDSKEKIILSVGRMGTIQKGTEILLNAFIQAKNHISEDWRLVLVGTMEESFHCEYERLINMDEKIKKRITYLGVIENREILNEWYRKSAIFALPSRWESFGIAAVEALARGDYLLLTNLISYQEITKYGQFGKLIEVDDIQGLSKAIVDTCQLFEKGKLNNDENIIKYMKDRYCWDIICRNLDSYLS